MINHDNTQLIFNYINLLPDVLINIIYDFLPNVTKIFVNRKFYIEYHHLLKPYIIKTTIENYIRYIIKRDFDFVFEQILKENCSKWISIKKYIYKYVIYCNYLYFIKDYCIEHESVKCRIVLNNYLLEHGLCKNPHKKNINRNIRWKL
jgi:hypothetical protein